VSVRILGTVTTPDTSMILRYLGFRAAKIPTMVKKQGKAKKPDNTTIHDEVNGAACGVITKVASAAIARTCNTLFLVSVTKLTD